MATPHALILILAIALVATGCDGQRGSVEGRWRAQVDTLGDTVVVRTLSGSEWGHARLVADRRIGAVDGTGSQQFGRVGALAVGPAGEVLVYDAVATELRRFDAEGADLGVIGGPGSGPGQYRSVAGMAVLDDGRVVVNDVGNGRFTVYGADGEPLGIWPVRPPMAARRPLHPSPEGGVFLYGLRPREDGRPPAEVLVRLDGHGQPRDTLRIPDTNHLPAVEARTERGAMSMVLPFAPRRHWSVTAAGELVTIMGDRYAVDVHRADGSVLRIERAVDAVPVSPEERAAEEGRITGLFRRSVDGWTWDGPAIPTTRPPVQWVHTGRDGSIWVRVARPGSVIPEPDRAPDAPTFVHEPIVFDVFEPDGTFLGQVRAPDGLRLQPYPVVDRERVWAVVRDQDGVDHVVRLRVERAP